MNIALIGIMASLAVSGTAYAAAPLVAGAPGANAPETVSTSLAASADAGPAGKRERPQAGRGCGERQQRRPGRASSPPDSGNRDGAPNVRRLVRCKVAEALDIDRSKLQAAKESGMRGRELFESLGITREELQQASETAVAELVADGMITQEQADEFADQAQQRRSKRQGGGCTGDTAAQPAADDGLDAA